MTIPVTLQYSFAAGSGNRLLSNLDSDLVALRDAVNGLGNGSSIITSGIFTTADIGTANVSTISFSSATGGNVVITGGTADFSNLSLTGILQPNSGGTGIAIYTDGQVLIGSNLTSSLTAIKITAGAGAIVNTAPGTITVSANGVSVATQLRQAIFTSSGTFVPNSTTTHKIIVVGGGGCGGFTGLAANIGAGGGGGAGATAISWNTLTSGVGITVIVGSAGANISGGNSVVMLSGSNITAQGGQIGDSLAAGGIGNLVVNGGAGGLAINGVINITGESGAMSMLANARPSQISISGRGGSSALGRGGQPQTQSRPNRNSDGNPGVGFGAGGSGSVLNFARGQNTGGSGSPGIVIFEWLA